MSSANDTITSGLERGQFTGTWTLDPVNSTVKLKTKAMFGMVPVNGAFGEVSGTANVSGSGAVSATITVAAASLSTKNKKRDNHLRSADFFDAANHPQMVVTIVELAPGLVASGNLAVKGTQTPISFPIAVTGASDATVTVEAVFTIDRSELGIGFKKMGATKMLSTLTVHARFTRS